MTTLVINGPATISGSVAVPGDKSISHRALMLGAAAAGRTTLRNVAPGQDVASTARCLEEYGVAIERREGIVTIDSSGIASWREPTGILDCGNSGTTMRVLAGLAAQRAFTSTLDGDVSLRRRPMERVAVPLRALGADVSTSDGGGPPVRVRGGSLQGAVVQTGVASAQVKTAVLFAALGAEDRTVVVEPLPTRDHTERMLSALGADVVSSRTTEGNTVEIAPYEVPPFELIVAGDVSSASFLLAAAAVAGDVSLDAVGLNVSRIGFLEALRRMGCDVTWDVDEERMNEPVGTVRVNRSELHGTTIAERDVPSVHDELPILAVLATQAEGETVVRGAEELRVKESDRIASTVSGLRAMGADITEHPDGFTVRGPTPLHGGEIDSAGDHRIAMAFAVAGLVAQGETQIAGAECADISWPGFASTLSALGADVEER